MLNQKLMGGGGLRHSKNINIWSVYIEPEACSCVHDVQDNFAQSANCGSLRLTHMVVKVWPDM